MLSLLDTLSLILEIFIAGTIRSFTSSGFCGFVISLFALTEAAKSCKKSPEVVLVALNLIIHSFTDSSILYYFRFKVNTIRKNDLRH